MVGCKFKSLSTGEIFTIVEFHDKARQAIVENEEGKSRAYSLSTLTDKRKFEEIEVDEANETTPAPAGDNPVEKVNVPIKSVKQDPTTTTGGCIKEYIKNKALEIGADVCVASSQKFISFKINGKMFAAIFTWSKKSATLGVRTAAIEKLGIDPGAYKEVNHMMNCRFTFDELSDSNKNIIDSLLVSSKDYQLNK